MSKTPPPGTVPVAVGFAAALPEPGTSTTDGQVAGHVTTEELDGPRQQLRKVRMVDGLLVVPFAGRTNTYQLRNGGDRCVFARITSPRDTTAEIYESDGITVFAYLGRAKIAPRATGEEDAS